MNETQEALKAEVKRSIETTKQLNETNRSLISLLKLQKVSTHPAWKWVSGGLIVVLIAFMSVWFFDLRNRGTSALEYAKMKKRELAVLSRNVELEGLLWDATNRLAWVQTEHTSVATPTNTVSKRPVSTTIDARFEARIIKGAGNNNQFGGYRDNSVNFVIKKGQGSPPVFKQP